MRSNLFATDTEAVMAEGAGASGLAAVLQNRDRFAGRTVGIILCGGNIDARLLASIMVRSLARESRIIPSHHDGRPPGLLGQISTRNRRMGANILEVSHGRMFIDVPAKGVSIDLTVENP